MNTNFDATSYFYGNTIKTLIYLIVYIILIPIAFYIRYKISNTHIYSIVSLWNNRNALLTHSTFNLLLDIHAAIIPANIVLLGRKKVFTEMIHLESESVIKYIQEFIIELIGEKKPFTFVSIILYIKTLVHYLKNYNTIINPKIVLKLLEGYEKLLLTFPDRFMELSSNINISQVDITRYIKSRRELYESIDLDEVEILSIKLNIQQYKMRIIIDKYEQLMNTYRCQIIRNLVNQSNSDKITYILLSDILSHSLLPVIQNIQLTIHQSVNKLNGDLKGIRYKGYDL